MSLSVFASTLSSGCLSWVGGVGGGIEAMLRCFVGVRGGMPEALLFFFFLPKLNSFVYFADY